MLRSLGNTEPLGFRQRDVCGSKMDRILVWASLISLLLLCLSASTFSCLSCWVFSFSSFHKSSSPLCSLPSRLCCLLGFRPLELQLAQVSGLPWTLNQSQFSLRVSALLWLLFHLEFYFSSLHSSSQDGLTGSLHLSVPTWPAGWLSVYGKVSPELGPGSDRASCGWEKTATWSEAPSIGLQDGQFP